MGILNFVNRIGHKISETGSRIGQKISSIAEGVGRIASKVAHYGQYAIPLATAINPTAGAGVASLVAGAGAIGSIARKVGDVGTIVNKISRSGGSILQDPATTMSNLRSISKDIGSGRKSLTDAYNEAKSLKTGIQKLRKP